MAVPTQEITIGVRFHHVGKLYHFDSSAHPTVELGDYVIVETSRGRQLGQVMGFIPPDRVESKELKPITRMATARDLLMKRLYEEKELEALIDCRDNASRIREMSDVKFIKASYNYDGSTLTFLYTCEDNINTGKLRKQLARKFRANIEMRRVGSRDVARFLGEYGACGSTRCCSAHLTEFSPISIKMAKAQGISLNPSEITGMCGRLRCCLVYEFEQYMEARRDLPRRKRFVGTPHGEGKVIDVNPLKGTVIVYVENKRYEVHKDDLYPLEELRALQDKIAAGCSKESGERCDSGSSVQAQPSPRQARDDEEIDRKPPRRRHAKRRHSRKRRDNRQN